jgi:hypothetical protein
LPGVSLQTIIAMDRDLFECSAQLKQWRRLWFDRRRPRGDGTTNLPRFATACEGPRAARGEGDFS